MIEAALAYAARGWPVLPLHTPDADGRCSCGDPKCQSVGKHPRIAGGLKAASTDPEQVGGWWSAWPDANIGVRTGDAFDVLDVDSTEAGLALARMATAAGLDPDDDEGRWALGPMSTTGKGSHLLYAPTGHGNRSRLAGITGIDWRGRDGYIVAPPSLHATGRRYQWHEHCRPVLPLPAVPAWLLALVAPVEQSTRSARVMVSPRAPRGTEIGAGRWSADGLIGRVATAVEGNRNAALHWAACRVADDHRTGKVDHPTAVEALEQLQTAAVRAGLAEREAAATIRSAWRAAAAAA